MLIMVQLEHYGKLTITNYPNLDKPEKANPFTTKAQSSLRF